MPKINMKHVKCFMVAYFIFPTHNAQLTRIRVINYHAILS